MKRYSRQSRALRVAAAGAVLTVAQLGGASAASAAWAPPPDGEECAYPADVVTTTKVKLDLAVVKAGRANTAHATVTSDEGPVEGTVTFTVAGYASSTVPLVGGKASYALPTDLVAGGTYEVTAAANVTGCLLPSAGSAYVTVRGADDDIAGEDDEAPAAVVNRAAPTAPTVAPSSGLLPSVGADSGTGLIALGGAGLLAAGMIALLRARRRVHGGRHLQTASGSGR